jgi:hypothetical protein
MSRRILLGLATVLAVSLCVPVRANELPAIPVEGQPLAANVQRLIQALDFLGAPLPNDTQTALKDAARDATKIQKTLDRHVLFLVTLDADGGIKVGPGPAAPTLQQAGYTPVLVKIVNLKGTTARLRISSPQSGPVYAGVAELSMARQDQKHLRENENTKGDKDRFLNVELFTSQPMTAPPSGLEVEYAVALIYSSVAGQRLATIGFNSNDKRDGETAVRFDIKPAIPVKLAIADVDGTPTTARLTFKGRTGRVYPPQAKRLAPDLFFQQHIYRHDGETVLLPPGEFSLSYCRGPEYRLLQKKITIPAKGAGEIALRLERWVAPADYGFYPGDHHIHAAGCAHYTLPSEGVLARDMLRQVKGEGLAVGCLLTWGPCYQFQRQFFAPTVDQLSEPFCVLKYDIEVSGFGSQALGHVCLLNLKDQNYPGADGIKGWPTWTTPVLRWAKKQGAYTGYAHSASGLAINPTAAARRLLAELDTDKDGRLSPSEAAKGLLPDDFAAIDTDKDGFLSEAELAASLDRVADRLPNLAIPELNSVGAQEIFVTVPQGLCDFISAMDTARIAEWNCWYHLMNCGYPLKVSGETDFPCMSGTRVGQGRVYVQLGKIDRIDFAAWCAGLARGHSYVSDGYAHALEFRVNGKTAGQEVNLDKAGMVTVKARVAFSSQTPLESIYGVMPREGPRQIGDTVTLHNPRLGEERRGGKRRVEVVVNGRAVAAEEVPADDQVHELTFTVPVERSSWLAVRHFPQMHTNPVTVLVADKPIRASHASALWCAGCIEQLWRVRGQRIAVSERDEAAKTFKQIIERYRQIAAECPGGS